MRIPIQLETRPQCNKYFELAQRGISYCKEISNQAFQVIGVVFISYDHLTSNPVSCPGIIIIFLIFIATIKGLPDDVSLSAVL